MNLRRLKPLSLLLTLLASLAASSPSLQPARHGDFDHYTFALTWQPGICSTDEGCLPNQPKTPLIGLHGLWASLPQDLAEEGVVDKQWWSEGCNFYQHSDAAPALDPAIERNVETVMPHFAHSLLIHEYDKHVQCFAFNANQFFSTELAMRTAVVNSAFGTYLSQQVGHDVTHDAVVEHFDTAFATDKRTTLQLQCGHTASGQTVLTQFWITIPTTEVDAFPKPIAFMDTPTNQDTCPATFRVPAWGA
jgi:ribonuclease I